MFAGKAAAVSLPRMFLPTILVTKTEALLLKLVITIVSISEILFFSASIPCVIGTDVLLSLRDILVIWFERVVLSIITTIPIAMLLGFADVISSIDRKRPPSLGRTVADPLRYR